MLLCVQNIRDVEAADYWRQSDKGRNGFRAFSILAFDIRSTISGEPSSFSWLAAISSLLQSATLEEHESASRLIKLWHAGKRFCPVSVTEKRLLISYVWCR